MKVIYSGLESSGKSLKLAMQVVELVHRNAKWLKRSGIARPIFSNLQFTEEFRRYAEGKGIELQYWHNVHELVDLANCDVIIDEVANYFDARMWQDLTLDARMWLSMGAKMGIEIYGSAQDFAQVDKAFRRLVNELYHISKLIGSRRPSPTKPPVTRIWGVCLIRELDPMAYDEEKSKFQKQSILPNWFYIKREYCEIFDTTQKIQRSKPMPFRHIARNCEEQNCGFHKVSHI